MKDPQREKRMKAYWAGFRVRKEYSLQESLQRRTGKMKKVR